MSCCVPHPLRIQLFFCQPIQDCYRHTALQKTLRFGVNGLHCYTTQSWQVGAQADMHSQGTGFCPNCSTTLVSALTNGPVLPDDNGSLPSQSMCDVDRA